MIETPSAELKDRNLHRRIEIGFDIVVSESSHPVYAADEAQRAIERSLERILVPGSIERQSVRIEAAPELMTGAREVRCALPPAPWDVV